MGIKIDKLKHFLYSLLLVLVLTPLAYSFVLLAEMAIPIHSVIIHVCLMVLAIGTYKELVHDLILGKGMPEVGDFIADVLGIVVGYSTMVFFIGI